MKAAALAAAARNVNDAQVDGHSSDGGRQVTTTIGFIDDDGHRQRVALRWVPFRAEDTTHLTGAGDGNPFTAHVVSLR